ncbi:hypothetical protein CONCODRAFT_72464 [Conidiobolus coronatus NRRL 28638]|uniref:Protein-tyrosine phosphatase n=1 Tax=Conidiobolus coronatus (strain ATCC 28846 / CBS 209.66 / NRRL 28638) TaxID=796925 RepID=A0A137NZP3_CONC2|nr:hypothetical protein CONCODRAFT_72464 [Conidiobolus coronatus NRRL 28638]|eukprot:KXN68131.1 hypothetical protein CONCODRAFT_72464 [Conidiobolus coronatus NRRL 28638]
MADSASKNNPRMKLITIPESFGQVEDGIYRSEMIKPAHFPFIKTLNLSKVLVLSPEPPSKTVSNFFNNQNIEVCHLGQQSWFNSNSTTSWRPISEEIIKEGLQFILNSTNHPILIMCTLGIHETGAMYRSYSGSKSRRVIEQFIELFDLDLINLPQNLPDWYLYHLKLLASEEE